MLQTNISNAYAVSGVAFPYTANIRYNLDLTNPSTPLVMDLSIKNVDGIYQPIDPMENYERLCRYFTKNYLASMPKIHSLTRQRVRCVFAQHRITSFSRCTQHNSLKWLYGDDTRCRILYVIR